MKHFIFATVLLLLSPITQASLGQDRGGGDLCEDQIKIIRDDIASWIQKGGAKDLQLPAEWSVSKYSENMLAQIGKTKIRCIGQGDANYPVQVYGTPKICRFDEGFLNKTITCDRAAFLALDETQQYILTHHEYAGLAGVERPNQDDSVYAVSNQISAYLVDQVVKRLAVKSVSSDPQPTQWTEVTGQSGAIVSQRLQDALARTQFIDCDTSILELEPGTKPSTCNGQSYYDNHMNFTPKKENKGIIEQGWQKFKELSEVVPNPQNGIGLLGTGRFSCEGGNSRDAKWNRMFSGRDSSGAEIIQAQLYQFMVDIKNGGRQTVHLQSTYQLDRKSLYVTNVEFRVGLYYKKNIGLATNPKWVDDFVTIERFTCHSNN
jgi:hypothetical protein